MSHLTDVHIDFSSQTDTDAIALWIADKRRQGYFVCECRRETIERMSRAINQAFDRMKISMENLTLVTLGCHGPPAPLPDMPTSVPRRYRFVDKNLALLFKLTFSGFL